MKASFEVGDLKEQRWGVRYISNIQEKQMEIQLKTLSNIQETISKRNKAQREIKAFFTTI